VNLWANPFNLPTVVGRAGFEFFWLAKKWVGLGWLTKSSTRGGLSRVGPDYPFWQLYL